MASDSISCTGCGLKYAVPTVKLARMSCKCGRTIALEWTPSGPKAVTLPPLPAPSQAPAPEPKFSQFQFRDYGPNGPLMTDLRAALPLLPLLAPSDHSAHWATVAPAELHGGLDVILQQLERALESQDAQVSRKGLYWHIQAEKLLTRDRAKFGISVSFVAMQTPEGAGASFVPAYLMRVGADRFTLRYAG